MFIQIARGVDDAAWLFHLRRGDSSRWFREAIKDAALADMIEGIERNESLTPAGSRERITKAIEERYTAAE